MGTEPTRQEPIRNQGYRPIIGTHIDTLTMPSNYLLKKPSSPYYYARLRIPNDVRGFLGKREFVESLKTESLTEARRKSIPIIKSWMDQIESARQEINLSPQARYIKLLEEASLIRSQSISGLEPIPDEVITTIAEELKAPSPIQKKFYQIAKGVYTPLEIGGWLRSISKLGPKTQFEYKKLVQAFVDEFQYLENLKDKKRLRMFISNQPTKSLASINNYLRYLQSQGILESDVLPTLGIQKPAPSVTLKKAEFSVDEISQLHTAIIKLDNLPLLDLFLIGIYTGARIEEICRLTTNDVIADKDGYRLFAIRKSKTESGERSIPVHSQLIQLIDQLIASSKDGYLIKTDAINKFGSRSGSLSKTFGRLKRSLGFAGDKSFHSIRRTVATLLNRQEFLS